MSKLMDAPCPQCGIDLGLADEQFGHPITCNACKNIVTVSRPHALEVVITDIEIPFSRLVTLLITLLVALVPAAILAGMLYFFVILLLGRLLQ